MKEVKLSDKDHRYIMGDAHRNYLQDHVTDHEAFLSKCYLKSFLGHLKNKDLIAIGGKLYARKDAIDMIKLACEEELDEASKT